MISRVMSDEKYREEMRNREKSDKKYREER
jgi:hypothetical protein